MSKAISQQLSFDDILNVAVIAEEREIDNLRQSDLELYVAATTWTVPVLDSFTDFFEKTLVQVWNGRQDENVRDLKPDGKGGLELKIGNIQFWMKKPALSPSYAEMSRGLLKYMANMLSEWGAGKKIEGVLEIDNKLYISVQDLYRQFRTAEIMFTAEKRPEIKYNPPEYNLEDATALANLSLRDFGKLTPLNARRYRIAKEQLKLIEKIIIENVRDKIKAEMIHDEDLDTTIIDGFRIGRFLVMDMMSPREIIKYKGVYDGIKEYIAEGKSRAVSEGKGHDIFRLRDGAVYAEISGIAKKFMDAISDPGLNNTTVQHRIVVLPVPKYDWVVVTN